MQPNGPPDPDPTEGLHNIGTDEAARDALAELGIEMAKTGWSLAENYSGESLLIMAWSLTLKKIVRSLIEGQGSMGAPPNLNVSHEIKAAMLARMVHTIILMKETKDWAPAVTEYLESEMEVFLELMANASLHSGMSVEISLVRDDDELQSIADGGFDGLADMLNQIIGEEKGS